MDEREPAVSAESISGAATPALVAEPVPLGLDDYQRHTRDTDQNARSGAEGLHLPILGLFGEVGGLLSELKKKQRDENSYIGYRESVTEEFGDALWYFANIADRAGLPLSVLAQRIFRGIPDWDQVDANRAFATFADIQTEREHQGPTSDSAFEKGALNLAAKTGVLLEHFSSGAILQNRDVLSADLVEIFRALVQAAEDADISLDDTAKVNIKKTLSRWPKKKEYVALFDARFPVEEQLPRTLALRIEEKNFNGRVFVMQQAHGINIGDRLTDNIAEPDDYRFHDVFHWAYASILGWSPVTRALLRLKRKSDPRVDENEDGARAQLIEEGVATWVFNHGRRLNFYENIPTVDYRLLKSIKEFVRGYEVERCPLWLWEQAILEGFRAFRFLRQHRRGELHLDLESRKLEISRLR
jgi:NTP pyrophosphatase (non-canonical NTP hydrolase)